MRNRIAAINIMIIMLIWPACAHAQQDTTLLSFDGAVQMMRNQNPVILRSREVIVQKKLDKKVKQGLYMPQVSIGAKAALMSEELHLDLTPVRDAILPLYDALGNYGNFSGVPNPDPATNAFVPVLPDDISTSAVRGQILEGRQTVADAEWVQVLQKEAFATVTADVVWPIFTGGKIKGANKAAELDITLSEDQLRVVEGNMLSELVTRYYGLALTMQVQEVRKQMLNSLEKHTGDSEKLYNGGMIAKVEWLHASVARNEAQREYKKSIRDVEIVQSGLSATLSVDSSLFLPANQLFINKSIPSLEYWVSKAQSINPLLNQIETKTKMVDVKEMVEKGEYLPSMALIGTYNLAEKDLSPYVPEWMVGVGVKWSIFEGLSRHNKVKATRSMKEQTYHAQSEAKNSLKAYVVKLYNELNMQLEQINELESTLELALEYSRSTEKAFNEGFATSTQVVEAYTKVAQVRALRLKAFYMYDITLAKLLETAGESDQYAAYCSGTNSIIETLN